MAEELTVRVSRITEEVGLDEGRMPRSYIRVEFMVGKHGPFNYRFPRSEFKPELVRRHLEEFARELAQVVA
jgi:hypothetical protein